MSVKLQAAKDIKSAIKIIAKKGPEYDRLIHDTVIQTMLHAKEHGDLTLLAELVGGKFIKKGVVTGDYPGVIAQGYGTGDLKSWIMGHTPVRFNGSTGKIGIPDGKNVEANWQIDKANENPFFTHPDYMARAVARAPFTMNTLQTLVQNLEKRITTALEAGKLDGDPVAMKAYVQDLMKVATPEEKPERIVHPKPANDKVAEEVTTTETLGVRDVQAAFG